MLHTLFGAGTWGVGGNLLADIFAVVPGLILGLWRQRKAMHARFDALEQKLLPKDERGSSNHQQTKG